MGYSLNAVQAEAVLQALKQNYSVYAPKRFPKQGRYSDTDVIKYAEVEHYEDIVWQVKSDYPAKEVLTPIQQAIFYFTEDEYRASKGPKKPILILARPCDINAQHVQAKIYAGNGGYTDLYYERMREKVKFALMECNGGDDTCFCVSMGTNKTDDYSLALKFSDEGVQVQVTDETFAPYFEGMPQAGYTPAFVEENELKVTVPDLDDKAVRLALKSHPMWKEFDGRCISCGACTVAFTGESDTPRQVVDLLQEEIERMRREGVDPEVFMLVKNQMYGELLGDVEAVDDAAEEAAAACLKGRTLADEIAALAALTVEDANALLQTALREENRAYVQIDPAE